MSRILLAGEQVTEVAFGVKGFDYYGANTYKEDGQVFVDALTASGHKVDWLRTCNVPVAFPEKMEELKRYQVVILSDVGSNTLYFHPEMVTKSVPHPDRLKLIRDYVAQGGAFIMVGGWMSFAGIDGRARYHGTPVEEVLPVTCLTVDDRKELPEGAVPVASDPSHPVLAGMPSPWPFFLGYNQVTAKPQAKVLVKIEGDPLLAVWSFGKGKSAAFTSDCAPHWGPPEFLKWPGYQVLWQNLVKWLMAQGK